MPMHPTWDWEINGKTATRTHNGRHVIVTARNAKEIGEAISKWEAAEKKRMAESLKSLGEIVDEALDRRAARGGNQSAEVEMPGAAQAANGLPVSDQRTS